MQETDVYCLYCGKTMSTMYVNAMEYSGHCFECKNCHSRTPIAESTEEAIKKCSFEATFILDPTRRNDNGS